MCKCESERSGISIALDCAKRVSTSICARISNDMIYDDTDTGTIIVRS